MDSKSYKQTILFAYDFAQKLKGGEVIFLDGELGSGKTQFVKGVSKGLGVEEVVISPTFVIMKEYAGTRLNLVHIDLYRVEDFDALGFDINEYVTRRNVVAIEWADKFRQNLPKPAFEVHFDYGLEEDERKIEIAKGDR